jgi:ferrous iron transport protein A
MRAEAEAGLASGPAGPFREALTSGFPDVRASQTSVTLVVADLRERVRIELELKMIFNFIFGRHKKPPKRQASALADLHVGEKAILAELELSPPVVEHLMNLGFVPGLEVTVARSSPGGDPRVYRVEGTEVAMRRDLSRHIHVELAGAPVFGD